MNYQQQYNQLVESRKNRILDPSIIYEKHHIIPACFGGKRNKENLVYLTYREHYIAHKLLFEFSEGQNKTKMGFALHRICNINNKNQTYRIKNNREYEKVKTQVYNFIKGENHPSHGVVMWNETERKNISNRMMGEGNHRYGKRPWNYGLTKETNEVLKKNGENHSKKFKEGKIDTTNLWKPTEETNKKISKALEGKPKSQSHRNNLSKANLNKKATEETKLKMSQSQKGIPQKKLTCPHCGKMGGTTMHRWHFDNCKNKTE